MASGWFKGQNLWVRAGRPGEPATVLVVRRSLGCAVDRNRLKRRLRSIFRELEFAPASVVVFPQPSALHLPYPLLRDELGALLHLLNGGIGR